MELDEDTIIVLKQSIREELSYFDRVKSMFYSRLQNKEEAIIVFNQLYAEAMIGDGQQQSLITNSNFPITEQKSVLMANPLFHSNQNQDQIPENADVALLSSKHNACPCIIGVNKDSKVAFLWHISYSKFELSKDKISIPADLHDELAKGMTFVGLNLPAGYTEQLPDISVQQNYSLPEDIRIETCSFNKEPLSYDISYYPNSDTVILFGTDNAGLPCAWHRQNVVNSAGNAPEEVPNWRKTILGITEHPTVNWENFLLEYYETHTPPSLSGDALIKEFYTKLTKKEEEKLKNLDNDVTKRLEYLTAIKTTKKPPIATRLPKIDTISTPRRSF